MVELLIQYDAKVDALTRNHISPLHLAAKDGHYSIVELLVKHSAQINVASHDDLLPIHLAAANGYSDIVKLLLPKIGISGNFPPKIKITALHVATQNGHIEVVQTLLADIKAKNPEKLAEFINAPDLYEETALDLATRQGYTPLVQLLLAEGAQIDILNSRLITPLHLAVMGDHTGVIKILLDYVRENYTDKDFKTFINAQENDSYLSALHLAASNGNHVLVKLLLDEGANIQEQTINQGTALMGAAGNGHSHVVKTLLTYIKEKKPEKLFELVNHSDIYGLSALHQAALQGFVEIMGLLLAQGARINGLGPDKKTPLMLAAANGFSEAVQFLLANNAQVDATTESKKRTALFLAAKNGYMDVVKVLLAYIKEKTPAKLKQFINTSDIQGLTVLHLASANGHAQLVAHLLMEGAAVNQEDQHKLTPLHLAAENGQAAVVKCLLAHHAKVNSEDENKLSAIHKATHKGYTRVIKILLNNGAEVDSLDNDGSSPLHIAAFHGDFQSIKLLIAHKAKKEIKNNAGKTPWDLAQDALEKQPSHPELERIRLLLRVKTQVEAVTQQQHYLTLSKFISEHFPTVRIIPVIQGLYLPSFASRRIKIEGQCAAITRAFSQSVFLSPTWGSPRDFQQSFLNNLQTSAELYERLARGKQISVREEREIFGLSHLLDDFKYAIDSSTNSLPASLMTTKHYSTLADFENDLNQQVGDFALHIVTENHVTAIYRKANQYAYFDSNVAYTWGLKSISELMMILNQATDPISTITVEYFNVAEANQRLSNKQKIILTQPLKSERFLLSQQDQQQGKLNLQDDKWVSRVELYDLGTKIEFLGETAKLINADMDLNDERVRFYLSHNLLSLSASDYIKHVRGKQVKQIFKRTEPIPILGTRREVQMLTQLRQLINQDVHDQLKPAVINALLKTTPERALNILSDLEVQHAKKWPNRLTNAAGRISQIHSAYSILQAALLEDKKGFALGVGEMGFSLFSQLIEDKIVKLAPLMIKRLKHGLMLSRGVAGVVSSPFDIYDLIESSINAAHAIPHTKEWRDNIASATLSGGSLIVTFAATAAKKPGIGSVAAVALIAIRGLYSGSSMVLEYKQYSLTTSQEFRLFMHTFAMQAPPQDVQYLEARQNLLNEIAENMVKHLSNNSISAYVSGLGEIIFRDGENPCNIRQLRMVSSGRTRCTKKTPKIPTVVASPAKIMMGLTDHGNYRYFLSRIVTDKVLYHTAYTATCLPAFTGEPFEYDDTLGKGWPLHRRSEQVTSYCENAMVIEDIDKENYKKIVYDLDLISGGTIVGRDNGWHNTFLMGKEPNKIMGGENASNLFILSSLAFGEIWGGQNATNILDLTQVKGDININDFPVDYDRKSQAQQRFQTGNPLIYGVTTWVISADISLHYLTQPVTVYVKPSAGSSHLHLSQANIVFTDTLLLKECDHFIYSSEENSLELKIKDFSLTLHNYFDQNHKNCPIKLIDQHGSVIEPLVDFSLTHSSQEIKLLSLKATMELTDDEMLQRYDTLTSSKSHYQVFGEVKNSVTGGIGLWGTQQSDMIPLNHEIRYAQAGEGEDAYYLTLTSSAFNATIDNFAEDRQWDLLYLPLPITDIKAYKVSDTLLIKHVNESMAISIKNYFFTSFYRHLIIMDAHQASFIPWLNESTFLPSLMPFFRATEHKKFFSFDTEKLAGRTTLWLATRYKTIKFYREAHHLLLIGDNNLVVKLEAFYDHPNKLSIGFWYDHRQNEMLNPTQLYEFAKLAIDYDNELISLYQDQIIEYPVAAKNLTIQHHQAESDSTSVTKRFGILRFNQPTQVIVAKNQHDLLLSTDKSNVTLKNWDRLDYRISAVRFGDDDDYFILNNLEQFDLSQINSLQSLFNFANLQHLARKQLNAINTEVVNAIKLQLLIQGLENNYTTFHCLGFNSVDAEQAFLTLSRHLKMYHHSRHDHAVKAVIGLFVLGYSNVLVQNQGNYAATSMNMKQCFKTLLGDSLSDKLISKLEKQTTEISEHLESNLKRFVASHHATIQENLSIAFNSMLRAEVATDQPRIRRDVSTHEIFSSPTQKTLANKPLLTNKPASTTLNNYDVSFEQNFIFTKWLFGYVFKQGSLIQRMASIQKLAHQESETSLVNIEKRFQSAILASEDYHDDSFKRLIQDDPLIKKPVLRTQHNTPHFFGLARLKSTTFGINTTFPELKSLGRSLIS